jgi:hypothetical protein
MSKSSSAIYNINYHFVWCFGVQNIENIFFGDGELKVSNMSET